MCQYWWTGAVAKAILRSGGEVVRRECQQGNSLTVNISEILVCFSRELTV